MPSVTQNIPRQLSSFRELLVGLAEAWVDGGSDAVLLRSDTTTICLAGDAAATSQRFGAALSLGGEPWTFEIVGGPRNTEARVRIAAKLLSRLARRESEVDSTAAALIDANDQLLALYDLAAARTSTLSRGELVASLAADALRITNSGAVTLVCGSGHRGAVGDPALIGELDKAMTQRLDDVRDTAVLRASTAAGSDVVLRPIDSAAGDWLALAARPGDRFGTPQLKLLDAVCAHVADRLQLSALHEQELARAVIERDVATASALAAQALPKRMPTPPGLEVLGRCDPARLASGDYYTLVEFDDRLVFAAGDVSGKGLPAALVMTMVSSATKAAALRVRSTRPDELLQSISADVYDYLDDTGMFVTTVVGTWHFGSDVVYLANAGHSPVILASAERDGFAASTVAIKPSMPPLGVLPLPRPTVVELPFRPGDTLLFGTDGLAEQVATSGEQLGYDTLDDLLLQSLRDPLNSVMAQLFDRVEQHGAGAVQDDDRTALLLRRSAVLPRSDGGSTQS
jgi:serine phosphatase RsbU (regulator of sigma subunit)